MNNSQVITTITMPMTLPERLEEQAKHQGKLFTTHRTHTHEMINSLESKLSQKSLPELKTQVSAILEGIPSRLVPDWDLR